MYLESIKLEAVNLVKKIQYDFGLQKEDALPHLLKRKTLQSYANEFNIDILIETGTYKGDMIYGLRKQFKEIYSIELSDNLHQRAVKRFEDESHIKLYCGDSKIILPEIITKIQKPCLFWLDAHYSGGITATSDKYSPIIDELKSLFSHSIKKHIILIDDARYFDGSNGYPTLNELHDLVEAQNLGLNMSVVNDIIRIIYN